MRKNNLNCKIRAHFAFDKPCIDFEMPNIYKYILSRKKNKKMKVLLMENVSNMLIYQQTKLNLEYFNIRRLLFYFFLITFINIV